MNSIDLFSVVKYNGENNNFDCKYVCVDVEDEKCYIEENDDLEYIGNLEDLIITGYENVRGWEIRLYWNRYKKGVRYFYNE